MLMPVGRVSSVPYVIEKTGIRYWWINGDHYTGSNSS